MALLDMSILETIKKVISEQINPIEPVKSIGNIRHIRNAKARYNIKHRKRKHHHHHSHFKEEDVNEISVRDAAGHIEHIANVNIRMANGKIKSLPPGKSGSSGGGGK